MEDAPSVLVTGSSRGIGRAIAIDLGAAGYDMVVHYVRDETGAANTAAAIRDLGARARIVSFDVSNRDASRQMLEQDMEDHGAYYGVVCNAGVADDAAFPMLSGEAWDKVIHTNLDGFYNVVQPLVMPMIRRRKPGRIVTISSQSGVTGNRGQVNYSAAKAGIIGATKALAVELAKRKITVNCVAPGLIETDMVSDVPMEEILKMIPAQRIGKPEEVAGAVRFLLSESAAYITRQVISVNGGLS